MIPKIVAKGSSFKGAAAYLLHDKNRADTCERVEWCETRNLMTDDPDKAWKIMAATAMDQDRLKAEAGIKATGRKSSQSVLHLVLSWHPDEAEDLNRDEMRRAAIGALSALGADDRQAMLVAHNDEKHAHLHVLCNRVSPEDGRMLTSSKDRLKLSEWAESYERERGLIFCENRVANNERRREGEFVADESALPHHLAKAEELARTPANDNLNAWDALQAVQKAKDRALLLKGTEMAEERKEAWDALTAAHEAQLDDIQKGEQDRIAKARSEIGRAFHPRRLELNTQIEAEREAFEAREERIFGRIANAMQAARSRFGQEQYGESRSVIGDTFQFLSSAGARREALDERFEVLKAELNQAQQKETENAKVLAQREAAEAKTRALSAYREERNALAEQHERERADLKVAWQERRAEREAALQAYSAGTDRKGEAQADFSEAANPSEMESSSGDMRDPDENLLDEIEQDQFYDYPGAEHDDDYEQE